MSKRNRREHGRILSVETMARGDSLADDFAAGVTSITVNDAGDFDEDGGWLYVGAQTVAYSECDDDTGIITLADPLAAAAEQGDPVRLWSDLYGEVVEYQQALVELDGEYDNPDPVAAEVAEGVGELPEGDRGRAGESCTLHRVADDEWEVVGVGGRSRKSQSVRWEQDDYYALTAEDITAGSATMPLSHRPNDEALTAVLAGAPQRPTSWTIDYSAQTLTVPLSGWEKAGDVLWVHYAYRKGIATASVTATVSPTFVAYTSRVSGGTGLDWPTGTQEGDLVIVGGLGGWDGPVVVTDARLTMIGDVDHPEGNGTRKAQVWAGYASDLGTPLAVSISETSSATAYMHIAVAATWRGVGGEHLTWKPGAVASFFSTGSTTALIPGLPDGDLSGAIMVYLGSDGTGGVFGDQDWSKAPEYDLKFAREDTYVEIDMALTKHRPVASVTTPNTEDPSRWTAFVIGVQ